MHGPPPAPSQRSRARAGRGPAPRRAGAGTRPRAASAPGATDPSSAAAGPARSPARAQDMPTGGSLRLPLAARLLPAGPSGRQLLEAAHRGQLLARALAERETTRVRSPCVQRGDDWCTACVEPLPTPPQAIQIPDCLKMERFASGAPRAPRSPSGSASRRPGRDAHTSGACSQRCMPLRSARAPERHRRVIKLPGRHRGAISPAPISLRHQ